MYCKRRIVKEVRQRHPNRECDVYEGFLISLIDGIYYDLHHIRSSYFDKRIDKKLTEAEECEAEKVFGTILHNFRVSWEMDKEIVQNTKNATKGVFSRIRSLFRKAMPKEVFLREFRETEPENTKNSWAELERFNSVFESGMAYHKRSFAGALPELNYRSLMQRPVKTKPTMYDYLDEYMDPVFGYLEVLNVRSRFEEIQTTSGMDKEELLRLPVRAMMEVDSWGNRNEVMLVLSRILAEKRMEENFVDVIREYARR